MKNEYHKRYKRNCSNKCKVSFLLFTTPLFNCSPLLSYVAMRITERDRLSFQYGQMTVKFIVRFSQQHESDKRLNMR